MRILFALAAAAFAVLYITAAHTDLLWLAGCAGCWALALFGGDR